MSNFDYSKAQEFELAWQKQYILEHYAKEYEAWTERRKTLPTGLHPGHFFSLNMPEFEKFLAHIPGKVGLDVGCGSFPMIKEAWQIEDRFVLDPLAWDYHHFQFKNFQSSFFEGLGMLPYRGEQRVESLVGSVNGFIIFRNALDHSEDPLAILSNLSDYATQGCYLLFWSDIWHTELNDGHRNITRSEEAMKRVLKGMGFHEICRQSPIRNPNEFKEYGGVFIKW